MEKQMVENFLKDMTYNSSFRILEVSKDKEELEKIANKRGIILPAKDLSIFKCTYAYVDRFNKNGCRLVKEDVEEAIKTLAGKAVDFDHYRQRVVGYWLDGEIEGEEIVAYGAFFKGNFPEDYEDIQELFDKGNLAVSFEAYGKREFTEDGKYDLKDIEFAGGALLIKTKPAFAGAGVLEMAKQDELVLEYANTMVEPKTFIREGIMEQGKYSIWDSSVLSRLMYDVECPICKEKGQYDIQAIDFEENTAKVKCWKCEAILKATLSPSAEVIKKGKKLEKVEKLEEYSKETTLDKSSTETKQEDSSVEELTKLQEQITAKDAEIASLKEGLEKSNAVIEELKKVSEEAKSKIETMEKEIASKIEEAKKSATIVAERKGKLGEFAKDMSDEDLLNDVKFENATLKMELATIKASKDKKVETASETNETLEKGRKIDSKEEKPTWAKNQERIRKMAFGA